MHFMVSIGKCKHFIAMEHTGSNPYLTEEARVEAFWRILLVGQTTHSDLPQLQDEQSSFKYQDWLPLVPGSWIPSSRPLLPTSRCALAASFTTNLFGLGTMMFGPKVLVVPLPGVGRTGNSGLPEDWTESG